MPANRLSALDVAFLCLESDTTPMHMGAVVTFRPGEVADPARLTGLLADRARRIPRLRRRVRTSWPPLGGAQWTEDPGFDVMRHIEVHHLTDRFQADPLAEHASYWIAEPLDPETPLWNAQIVTGLPGGEFALLLKFHHAFADGQGAVEVALGLLDGVSLPRQRGAERPKPAPARSPLDVLWDSATTAIGQAGESAGIAGAVLRAARPYPVSPTATPNSRSRRLGFVRLDMGDVRRVRRSLGGTTNDVVLAVLAGALRDWMTNRGRRPEAGPLRALVPVSLRGREAERAGGNVLSGYLCDLPVELEDPAARLRAVRATMDRNKKAGPARGAGAIPILANRVPAGVHRIATKVAGRAAPLLFDTVVTNVPLPGVPMTFGGAALREVYPFVPLAPHQAVGVAVSSYRDTLHVGLQANGEAVPDVGSLGDAVTKSMAALLLSARA
ncbi:WS/DGAT/MGAT family acyltransferase [Prauserella shujinwangii]|uniref:Diacylglycerol O-acyltransferase n=1 Tax=Prauserella shujinwangii TaxID=1453103 RepID=A0A2T0LZJ0_9PSEU|nr:wax ester/triacylglycerol synthase family O-acyltransferase [Prauserella shujinwangii]PRX49534.1 WS/DGAT/MGAT family acyltransferase [Prauserella shujinwangii]